MTDLLKKLHAELTALFNGDDDKEEAPPKKKAKPVVEEEDEDEVTEKVVKKKAKVEEPEDADDDEDEEAPKKKKGKATIVQVKAKLKELLDAKGRDAAVKVLEAFDAEKVGDIDEDSFEDFITSAQKVIDKGPNKKAVKTEDEDDLG